MPDCPKDVQELEVGPLYLCMHTQADTNGFSKNHHSLKISQQLLNQHFTCMCTHLYVSVCVYQCVCVYQRYS